jgi:opacity protein-like surface antigen
MVISRFRLCVAAAIAALVAAAPASAQQEYPATLYWGSGLIDIPTAWVAPLTGDFFINYTGKRFEPDPTNTKINYSNSLNSQLVFSLSGWGRLEAGYAAYSSNPEWGFFGKAMLLREDDYRDRVGLAHWLPSLAVGIRNVGPYKHIDRFGIGYELIPPPPGDPDFLHEADELHQNLKTNNSVYGVATKGFSLAEIRPSWPDINLSFTAGFGGGLFSDDGGIPNYGTHDRNGLFYGVKTDFSPAPNVTLSLMAEDNSWDYNLGASAVYRGIRAGVYLTELGGGSAEPDPTDLGESLVYGYQKVAFTLSWQSNVYALLRGEFLQSRAAQLERQRQALLAEIAERQQRIAALDLEINRYEAQNLLELEQRRVQAEEELRREREALRTLEERLRRIENMAPPPAGSRPPPPPGSPPPSARR